MPIPPIPSESQDSSSASSIYEQLGGHEAVRTVVEELYVRVLADAALAPFFVGINMTRMKGRQTEFFSAALGGPHRYSGASMKQVHRGRGITSHHFDLVAEHLTDAMSAAGVPPELLVQVLAVVSPLADDIAPRP
ncbi:group 1 truncated hemoglobin [Nocardia sp. NPDC058633]|uniref:group I truncated hemoglobin n=1 Tax=Nocardia sp. NPDC058633 TaxID=3346568 RepID=UPI0036608D86